MRDTDERHRSREAPRTRFVYIPVSDETEERAEVLDVSEGSWLTTLATCLREVLTAWAEPE